MNYKPSYRISPIKDAEFPDRIKEIQSFLAPVMETGSISSFDGISLQYYWYPCENPVGTVVIVHGFTEFALKYEEIIYYFLEMGYNCFIYDQRSHGYSGSGISDHRYNHVEDFRDYSKDLNVIMEQVVKPFAKDTEIYIYCHSMGGTVNLHYFHDFKPDFIKKAVFSSPMVVPRMAKNIPFWIVEASIRKSVKKDGWNAAFPHTSHFNPNASFDTSHDCSRARFDHNLALRVADEHYQNSGSTNRWLWECLKIRKYLPKKEFLSEISQNILVLKAGQDSVVYTDVYKNLEKFIPSCKVSDYPSSRHSIYNSDDETLVRYWNEVFTFLKS